MVHGVYIRSRPTSLWHLISVVSSGALAEQDKKTILAEAFKHGNSEAQTAIQTFESVFFIPECLKEIKEDNKLLYN